MRGNPKSKIQNSKSVVGRIDAEEMSLNLSLVGVARTDDVTIEIGGAGVARASNSVSITQYGRVAIVPGGLMTVMQGGGTALLGGGSMTVTQGGGQAMLAGGSMTITQGGGGVMVARDASVEKSIVGALICWRATLGDGTRVLL